MRSLADLVGQKCEVEFIGEPPRMFKDSGTHFAIVDAVDMPMILIRSKWSQPREARWISIAKIAEITQPDGA